MLAELLGVRLLDVAPTRSVEFPLSPGVAAITGLNGVGKTRVLRGIFSALSGAAPRPGGCQVMFRWHHDDSDSDQFEADWDPFRQIFRAVFDTDDQRKWHSLLANRMEGLLRPLQGKTRDIRIGDHGLEIVENRYSFNESDIAQALLNQRLFALVPESGETFKLMVAMDRRTEDPTLRRVIQTVDNAWDYLDDLEEYGDEDFWVDSDMFDAKPFPKIHDIHAFGGQSPFAGHLLPVPVVELARFHLDVWPLQPLDVDTDVDLIALTQERLAATIDSPDRVLAVMTGEHEYQPSDEEDDSAENVPVGPLATAAHLSAEATRWYQRLLPDSPSLTCVVAPVEQWMRGSGAYWEAGITPLDSPFLGEGLSIADLGQAHQRWARFSIYAALTALDGRGRQRWLIIDEPELAVHRAAEHNLAAAMRDISSQSGLDIIVATHSPAVVRTADKVYVVRREAEESHLQDLASDESALAHDLGLAPTDLLGWYRNILLVEGLHDETVVTELLGDVLTRTRTLVIPLGGVRGTSATFDSRLLTGFLDAHLVLLVDGLGKEAATVWRQVQSRAVEDPESAAQQLGRAFEKNYGHEAVFLRSAGDRLIHTGRTDQLTIHALSVPDVVDLLPVEAFVPGATSWRELRKAWAAAGTDLDFKTWLRDRRGARISVRSIKEAIDTLDAIPADLAELAALLDRDSLGSGSAGSGAAAIPSIAPS